MKKGDLAPLFVRTLEAMKLPTPATEHRFDPSRKWRFDYAWPEYRVALEVEGGVWTGGRHTRAPGFLKDMEKYNAAACMGWRIIRTVPDELLTTRTIRLIEMALKA